MNTNSLLPRLAAVFVLLMVLVPAAHARPDEPDPLWPVYPVYIPGGAVDAHFGAAVAISPDGETLIAGSPGASAGDVSGQGVAYAYRWTGRNWLPQGELTAPEAPPYSALGLSAATNGSVAAIGGQDAVYIFNRSGSAWKRQAAFEGQPGEGLGGSVALSDDGQTLLAGASVANGPAGEAQGVVIVYTRAGGGWQEQTRLVAKEGKPGSSFGAAVAISPDGQTAIVGAPDEAAGSNSFQGAAYVFTRSGEQWAQSARLLATGGGAFDAFGRSVAIDRANGKTMAAVGAIYSGGSGAVYVFNQSGASWTQAARLTRPGAKPGDNLGRSVALDLDGEAPAVLAGANGIASGRGAAFVYNQQGAAWAFVRTLIAPDGVAGDSYGASVALVGTAAAVGAPDAPVQNAGQGIVYPYRRGDLPFGLYLPAILR